MTGAVALISLEEGRVYLFSTDFTRVEKIEYLHDLVDKLSRITHEMQLAYTLYNIKYIYNNYFTYFFAVKFILAARVAVYNLYTL